MGSVDSERLKHVHAAIRTKSRMPWLEKLILDTIESFYVFGRGNFCFVSERYVSSSGLS